MHIIILLSRSRGFSIVVKRELKFNYMFGKEKKEGKKNYSHFSTLPTF